MTGYLHIITKPSNLVTDIYIDGEFRGSKDINLILEPGFYMVQVNDIIGYTTPPALNVDVIENYETLIIMEYIKQ